jgi:nitrous oxidase accessory protein NosD
MARFLWQRRLLAIAAFFALGLLVVGAQSAAGATTLLVDDNNVECPTATYNTINAAVAAAGTGDTITVCPGTYNESVTISFPLTLLGSNAGVSWSGARGSEAIVSSTATTFNVTNGQDVTIDGFTINGDFGVYVSGSTGGTAIDNNITTGVTRALTLDAPGNNANVLGNDLISNVRSLHVSGGPYTNLKINGNRFSGLGTIFFSGALANSITGFEFKNNQVLHSSNLASNITNGMVSGNTFNAFPGSLLDTQMSLHYSTVTGNTFKGNDVNACFQLFGSQFGLVPSHDVTISGNTFSDCGNAAPPLNYAIQLSPDIYNITIRDNAISDGSEGVNTRDATPWFVPASIHINYNNITNNTSFGVRNGQTGILDAECNWWGAADGPGPVGPGSGDNVSPNVDYTPWLVAPAPGGRCLGGVPSTPGKVTGGGQVEGDPLFSPLGDLLSLPALVPSLGGSNTNATFGFVVKCCPETGNLEYYDHGLDVRIKAVSFDLLSISSPGTSCPATPGSKHATIHGEANVIRPAATTTEPITVDVDDCGEPGANDTFGIEATTYSKPPSKLIGGNIQIK